MSKSIYCIRHGISLHNLLYKKYGSKIFSENDYIDTSLLPEGRKQAMSLRKSWKDIDNIELVIVSPLKEH